MLDQLAKFALVDWVLLIVFMVGASWCAAGLAFGAWYAVCSLIDVVLNWLQLGKVLRAFAVKRERFEWWNERDLDQGSWDVVAVPLNWNPELELIVLSGHSRAYAMEKANTLNAGMWSVRDHDSWEEPDCYYVARRAEDEGSEFDATHGPEGEPC